MLIRDSSALSHFLACYYFVGVELFCGTESTPKPQHVVGQKFRSMQSENLGLNQYVQSQ